jgi:hypothetical protein
VQGLDISNNNISEVFVHEFEKIKGDYIQEMKIKLTCLSRKLLEEQQSLLDRI